MHYTESLFGVGKCAMKRGWGRLSIVSENKVHFQGATFGCFCSLTNACFDKSQRSSCFWVFCEPVAVRPRLRCKSNWTPIFPSVPLASQQSLNFDTSRIISSNIISLPVFGMAGIGQASRDWKCLNVESAWIGTVRVCIYIYMYLPVMHPSNA